MRMIWAIGVRSDANSDQGSTYGVDRENVVVIYGSCWVVWNLVRDCDCVRGSMHPGDLAFCTPRFCADVPAMRHCPKRHQVHGLPEILLYCATIPTPRGPFLL